MKTFPKILDIGNYFSCPIWSAYEPSYLKILNKASEPYLKKSKKINKSTIDKRNKTFGNKGDMGFVFHSTSLINDKKFKELQKYIIGTSHNLLDEMGFDLNNFKVFLTEMWVQEFAKNGAGYHDTHTHWNGHMSGFYFLKCSEKTSFPLFEDPRPGNVMNLLPEKDKSKITYATSQIKYQPKPGTFIFFPSYMPHQFVMDLGYAPFRFIHWNCQAIPKGALSEI
mgnify:CR=1 FL=1|jgi:uncharacterized protein (TIGR02466 family)|tara:strand:- start:653 stop:1324 length:672 start_codon:yes stop_codon:yes gene_type:complete